MKSLKLLKEEDVIVVVLGKSHMIMCMKANFDKVIVHQFYTETLWFTLSLLYSQNSGFLFSDLLYGSKMASTDKASSPKIILSKSRSRILSSTISFSGNKGWVLQNPIDFL